MLVRAVTHLDIAFGRIGLALQVKCPIDGSVRWLWGIDPGDDGQLCDEPPISAFLCDSLSKESESEIIPAIARLRDSGIITDEQHDVIQGELGQEALFVFAWWYVRDEPIPHVDSICGFLRSSETDAPPPMYRPIIGQGSE
jgi:hypothetical protein